MENMVLSQLRGSANQVRAQMQDIGAEMHSRDFNPNNSLQVDD